MGKRSDFTRLPRDSYPTPLEAVYPLLPHLKIQTRFIEPCAGDGTLLRHLEFHPLIEHLSNLSPRVAPPRRRLDAH